jgi:hypothetical protein
MKKNTAKSSASRVHTCPRYTFLTLTHPSMTQVLRLLSSCKALGNASLSSGWTPHLINGKRIIYWSQLGFFLTYGKTRNSEAAIWCIGSQFYTHSAIPRARYRAFPILYYFQFLKILRQGLTMSSRLASNSWSSCLCLPSAGITGECHHAQPDLNLF